MDNNDKSWGGARRGAGRRTMDASGRRVTIASTVAPETAEYLKALAAARGVSLGAVIDSLTEAHREGGAADARERVRAAVDILTPLL